ncbi:amidohydrolase [Thermocoleostomius sinensis]|uniref:Amidohydrolase n=1 Tax=Thermocoleostomius sinensis A174 TaxID=2016057 RepID=A0A9E8Z947_9CYAN|nr:amidohydrolase [Thermocoleostomius sinensis]WAL58794.1 amidohydrolase [Thermocoleostomius sinensis A174]
MVFTIQNALVLTDQGYKTLDVQVEADRITAIGVNLPIAGDTIDGQNKLLLPGFVNAHTHSPEFWQRGRIPPLPLELWLFELYSPKLLQSEQIYLSALGTAVETLLSGGTTIVDHLLLLPGRERETIDAAVRAYQQVGIRAFVAPLVHDQSLPTSLPSNGTAPDPQRQTKAVLDLLEEAILMHHCPDRGINLVISPTGLQLCSDVLVQKGVELSERYQLCRHTHLLETRAQQILAQEKYGCSAVEHLKRLEFLGPHTSLAHCVWLDDAEIDILAATGATVVHNPLSNLRLGSGIAPILKFRQAGVNVCFGCDGSASNDAQDVLEAIKIGTILHNITDSDYRHWITPHEAVQMASIGGAKGLGLEQQMGCIAIGQKADFVLYDLTSLSLLPQTDPVGLLVLGRPTQAVDSVWVNGQRIVADGKIQTVDVTMLKQELLRYSQPPQQYSTTSVVDVEQHYRSVMGLST